MNFGIVLAALFLVCAATAAIFYTAQAPQYAYNDTWSQSASLTTNQTQGMVSNTTARVVPAAGGLAFLFAGTLVFVGIVYTANVFSKQGGYSQRR
jgi:hypothetical protein